MFSENKKSKTEKGIGNYLVKNLVGCWMRWEQDSKKGMLSKSKTNTIRLRCCMAKIACNFCTLSRRWCILAGSPIIGCAVWYNFGKERKTPQLDSWSVHHWLWQPNSLHLRQLTWQIILIIHATGLFPTAV